MNCTSAGEYGGKVARVEGGNVLVGWPGAPGWTTTGDFGSACCCALTGIDSKLPRRTALKEKHFIGPESLTMEGPTLPQRGAGSGGATGLEEDLNADAEAVAESPT